MRCSRCCSAVFLLALLAGVRPAARSQIIYDQPSIPLGGPVLPFPVPSQNDPNLGNFATAYDDFVLTNPALITDVHWTGEYYDFDPPDRGQVTGFTLRLYDDKLDGILHVPGSVLLSQTLPNTANETFVGTDLFNNPVYRYDVDLATPFAASAGIRYWLSVVADLAHNREGRHFWGWYYGTGGNGTALDDFFGTFNNPVPSDLTFSLTSHVAAATPEPSAVTMLLGAGLCGSLILRKRKR